MTSLRDGYTENVHMVNNMLLHHYVQLLIFLLHELPILALGDQLSSFLNRYPRQSDLAVERRQPNKSWNHNSASFHLPGLSAVM